MMKRNWLSTQRTRMPQASGVVDVNQELVSLWCLRLIAHFVPRTKVSANKYPFRWSNLDEILEACGVAFNSEEATLAKVKRLAESETKKREKHSVQLDDVLGKNIATIGKILQLNETEQALLIFFILKDSSYLFGQTLNLMPPTSSVLGVANIIAAMIGTDTLAVRKALRRNGNLLSTGLVEFTGAEQLFENKFKLIHGLSDAIQIDQGSNEQLFDEYFHRAPLSKLQPQEFDYLRQQGSLVYHLLDWAITNKTAGTNVLIYGEPGTGKTEWVRSLARSLAANAFEMATESKYGDPHHPGDRLAAFQLAQRVVSRFHRPLLLFDEVEDIFDSSMPSGFRQVLPKSHVNRILESNAVPVIWVCNEIGDFPECYLRRFDHVLRMPKPPRTVRLKIATKLLHDFDLSEAWLEKAADLDSITPGYLDKASKLAIAIKKSKSMGVEEALTLSLENRLKLSAPGSGLAAAGSQPVPIDLGFLNTDCNLADLIRGLTKRPNARICFYGPPGTGKTTFGKILSEAINRPLIKKRASDLLDKYVGQNERNIHDMFQQASDEGAVLMLDEADSMLQNRKHAAAGWEISMVNEMLTQMEDFKGIFIASTNFESRLDGASARRFDVKIKFDYLTIDQKQRLFGQVKKSRDDVSYETTCQELAMSELAKIDYLTPGDFATVLRRLRIMGQDATPERLIAGLKTECKYKRKDERPAGFMADL